ncbi:MAG: uncharacterized protein QOE61_2133 [Micromonosporaceae bacterium]|jgi:predicted acyl esterase|nr:uncharacterized protein [Micromonosporaceae bacterium]
MGVTCRLAAPGVVTRQLNLHGGAGRLDAATPQSDSPVGSFRYDPAAPTPSLGGPLLSRTAGVRDNATLEARPDVLTFTTQTLVGPVEVIGPVTAKLRVGAKAGSHFDVYARLCDVDETGRSAASVTASSGCPRSPAAIRSTSR